MRYMLLFLLMIGVWACADDPASTNWNDEKEYADLDVISYNLYFGASITNVALTEDTEQMALAVHQLYQKIKAVDFNKRGKVIAGIIAAKDIEVAALQEVITYSVQVPGDYMSGNTVPNASTVEYDFVKIILDELKSRGLEYEVALTSLNSDEELPAMDPMGENYDVRLTEADVIIMKKDASLSKQGESVTEYSQSFVFPLPGGGDEIKFERSLGRLGINFYDNALNIYNTHLEIAAFKELQESQAQEAFDQVMLSSQSNAIFAGDLNSGPHAGSTASYTTLRGLFKDSYAEVNPSAQGFTCCQQSDLMNPTSVLKSRIDHILYRGDDLKPVLSEVVGATPDYFNVYGFWPSDHAGVYTKFRVKRKP